MADKPAVASSFSDHSFDNDGNLTATGSANTYLVKTGRRIGGYYKGLRLCVRIPVTNTTASTLEVDEAGQIAIRKGGNTALTAGNLIAGCYYDFIFDDANNVLQVAPNIAATAFGLSLIGAADAAAALAILTAMGQGKHTIWVPASAMKRRTAGPATGSFSAGSTELDYLAFDASTLEDATFNVAMPKNWNEGSVSYQVYWMHPATTTNFAVMWSAYVKAYSNDDAIDGASYTTIDDKVDTGGTTNDLYISDESASTAVGTAAENDLLNFIIRRNASNGSDTLAVDAYLIGVKIFYTTNAATDA